MKLLDTYYRYAQHKYKIMKVTPFGKEISSTHVIGSRAAFGEQQNLEKQGFVVVVINLTKGVEEYRTDVISR